MARAHIKRLCRSLRGKAFFKSAVSSWYSISSITGLWNVSIRLQYLSNITITYASRYLGGVTVSGHICRRMIFFSLSVRLNRRWAFSSARRGCVSP